MGADSRTSTGNYVANRVSDKITAVSPSIYCCRSGSAADTQAISDIVKYYLDIQSIESGSSPSVQIAASLFQQFCYNNKDNLLAGIICAGWDSSRGGSVYSIPLGGSLIKQKWAIGGSGSTYIYAFCDSNYKDNMTKQQAQNFVLTALSYAMSRDGSSGGIVRLVTINDQGVEKKFIPNHQLPVPQWSSL